MDQLPSRFLWPSPSRITISKCNCILQMSSFRYYLRVVLRGMIPLSSNTCMVLVVMPHKHRFHIDDDFPNLKSLCQRRIIDCALLEIQIGARTDPNTAISFTSHHHKVARVFCIPVLEIFVSSLHWTVAPTQQILVGSLW